MSRSDDPRDDYDDFSLEQRSRSRPVAAVLVLIVAVGIITLTIIVVAGALVWAWVAPAGPAAPAAAPVGGVTEVRDTGATRRIIDRGEFEPEIQGATRDAVRKKVGPPSSAEGGEPEVWHYAGVTRDPATGKMDADAAVVFENGRVKEVRFKPAANVNRKGN